MTSPTLLTLSLVEREGEAHYSSGGRFDIQGIKANQKNLLLSPTSEWATRSYKEGDETG